MVITITLVEVNTVLALKKPMSGPSHKLITTFIKIPITSNPIPYLIVVWWPLLGRCEPKNMLGRGRGLPIKLTST